MKQPTEQNLPMENEKMRIFSIILLCYATRVIIQIPPS
ncbi:hypothetical protein Krac_6167 [Ktedonobacter racemifer DSM 44963]|uniref:Uncharacterized protein n=1 Tax=Ktedonobacter racemifer DSM 44963 TaxID=485913 RepID=D6TY34_KTERA|nr:hypothetical protein Krac_6167 [Ktedonobacter racemifer DSM 44963]